MSVDPSMVVRLFFRNIILGVASVTALLLIGCRTSSSTNENLRNGRQIVIELNSYTQDALAEFPKALSNLVSDGFIKEVPKYKCSDGTLKDFVYIPGFDIWAGDDWVILTSPADPNSESTQIFFIGNRAKIVSKEEAQEEVNKSLRFLESRNQR